MKKNIYLFSVLALVTLSSSVSTIAFPANNVIQTVGRDKSLSKEQKNIRKLKEKAQKAAIKVKTAEEKAKEEREKKAKAINWLPPDSMENLIKDLDLELSLDNFKLVQHSKVPKMSDLVKKAYNYVKDKKGIVQALGKGTEIGKESDSYVFKQDFRNFTSATQEFLSQERTEQVTEKSSFTSTLNENITFSASASIPFIAEASLDMSFNAEQKWHDSKEKTITVKAPSQKVQVKPNSKLEQLYILKKGKYAYEGVIAYDVNLDDKLDSSYYWTKSGQWGANQTSFKDIVRILADHGFADQISLSSSDYSIIKTDDPYNPKQITLNLPLNWTSDSSSIIVQDQECSLTDEDYKIQSINLPDQQDQDVDNNEETIDQQDQDVDNNEQIIDQQDQDVDNNEQIIDQQDQDVDSEYENN